MAKIFFNGDTTIRFVDIEKEFDILIIYSEEIWLERLLKMKKPEKDYSVYTTEIGDKEIDMNELVLSNTDDFKQILEAFEHFIEKLPDYGKEYQTEIRLDNVNTKEDLEKTIDIIKTLYQQLKEGKDI